MSKIEWTDVTWNPVTGCTKKSAGCKNCYAERMAKRLKGRFGYPVEDPFKVTLHRDKLMLPYKWKKPRMIFVCSMGDLFHKDVPDSYIMEVFKMMNDNQRHTFQVLTKRPERAVELNDALHWTDNIWFGVSIEEEIFIDRMWTLKETAAKIKFISFEPLVGRVVSCNFTGIDWVIAGGETGIGARLMYNDWVLRILDACSYQKTPFFYKGKGVVGCKKTDPYYFKLNGQEWREMPKVVRG